MQREQLVSLKNQKMNLIQHPSSWLDHDILQQLRNKSSGAEIAGRLHEDQLELIHRNKWFNMYVPKAYDGLNLSLPEILKIEESLSWADGSVGWVVTLCSGAAWFVGFLNPHVADKIFTNEKVCIAGSGAPTGVAEINADGYVINGTWKYASGAWHATAFTMNCLIKENGHQLFNSDGSPKISSFILTKDEVTLLETWNSMGMIATGSHSFEVNHLQVPHNRAFIIDAQHAVLNDPIYKYPFLQLAETTLAVNISGMAIRFIDLAEEINNSGLQAQTIQDIKQELQVLRQSFYNHAEESWSKLIAENKIPESDLTSVSDVSHTLVQSSRAIVNTLYPLCGLRAAAVDSEINRVWRNFHTAGQHALFTR